MRTEPQMMYIGTSGEGYRPFMRLANIPTITDVTWAGLDNDTEYHQYSITVRKYGNSNEEKMVVLARSPIDAAKLVPKGYTVENISKLFG